MPRRRLPTFADVGGLEALKDEVRNTIGLLLAHPEQAERFRITWNGVLIHGPPGSGKSFFVRAVEGELGLNLVPVTTADLVTDGGDGPQRVVTAFEYAAEHLPCLLFFDELDAVARERDAALGRDGREVVTQLLHSVEAWRSEPRLLVAAATNDLDALDPAVIRAGRFDRHIRLDLPGEPARRAVLEVALAGRPHAADLPLEDVARRTRGRPPADLVQLCDVAALAAFRDSIGGEGPERITARHLLDALDNSGGEDRPSVEEMSWDDIVLAPDILAELQQVQALLEDPGLAERLGVESPSGVLLTGPPGTGKTTVAKVLAAEAACSFYPMSAAELFEPVAGREREGDRSTLPPGSGQRPVGDLPRRDRRHRRRPRCVGRLRSAAGSAAAGARRDEEHTRRPAARRHQPSQRAGPGPPPQWAVGTGHRPPAPRGR